MRKPAVPKKTSLEKLGDNFTRCPEGHDLPHKTGNGRCTPLFCAVVKVAPTEASLTTSEDPTEARVQKTVGDEEVRVKIQSARQDVWRKFLQVPIDLRGADAEKYADDELVGMLPFAVSTLKKQLLYGTEEQQERAASKVMDATGRGRKESAGNTSPTIVLNFGGQTGADGPPLPWRKASATVVDAVGTSLPALPPNEKP